MTRAKPAVSCQPARHLLEVNFQQAPRDIPVPFQGYEFIGALEKVSHGALTGCQIVEDSAVSPC
jgi:hypothetical protein